MAKFITLDATTAGENSGRPARIAVDRIAYFAASGNQYDPGAATKITFAGGNSLVVAQTVAQVAAAIEAASA
jgi:hypothetical protein